MEFFMKMLFKTITILLFVYSLSFAEDVKKYGKDLSLSEATQVSAILSTPEEYNGKKVLIEVHDSPSNLPFDRNELLSFFTKDLQFELEFKSGDVWVFDNKNE